MPSGRKPSAFRFQPAQSAEAAADQLARFAVRAAVITYSGDLSKAQRQLSERTGLSSKTVSDRLSVEKVTQKLDETYVEFVKDVQQFLRDEYGVETYLTTFFNEIRRFGRGFVPEEAAELDREWFIPLTNTGRAHSKEMAMLRGWSAVAWIDHQRSRGQLQDQLSQPIEGDYARSRPRTYQERVEECVEDLLTVASMPAGQGHLAAASLLGSLGRPALDGIRRHVRDSPVGWRTVRAATQLLLYARGLERVQREPIERAVFLLLKEIHQFNYRTAYRARSFWEECADALPRPSEETYKGDYDEIIDILIERAITYEKDVPDEAWPSPAVGTRTTPSACPVRERQTAAVVAVERIRDWEQKNHHRKWDIAHRLIEPLRKSAQTPHKTDKEDTSDKVDTSETGRRYVELDYTADFLEYWITADSPSVIYPGATGKLDSFWGSRPEVSFISGELTSEEALKIQSTVDESLQPGLSQLVGAATLAVSGILRRRILESLVAGGLGPAAADLFLLVANRAHQAHVQDRLVLRFVIENALFNASYMNTPTVIPRLLPFCVPSDLSLSGTAEQPYRELPRGIRMTALHGIGDLAHWIQKDRQYSELRRLVVRGILQRFWSEQESEQYTRPELRAALHTLAMIRLVVDETDSDERSREEDGELQDSIYEALHALLGRRSVGGFVFAEHQVSERTPAIRDRYGEVAQVDRRTQELAVWCLLRMHTRQRVFDSEDEDCVPSRLVNPLTHVADALDGGV